MDRCESMQIELSALMDGELEHDDILRVLEHLQECKDCSALLAQMRRLEGALAPLRSTVQAERQASVWRAGPRLRALGVVAALLIAFVGGWTLSASSSHLDIPRRDEVLELSLGEESGKMADAQFVSMTVQLLRADPRYHRAMLEVLEDVVVPPAEDAPPAERNPLESSLPYPR